LTVRARGRKLLTRQSTNLAKLSPNPEREDVRRVDAARTSEVPEAERFDFWRSVVSETFVPLEASRDTTGDFSAEIRGASLGGLRLYEVTADPHVARRTARLAATAQAEYFKLGLQLEGRSVLTQDGREAALEPGDFAIYDTSRPYTFAFADCGRLLVLIFPRALLGLPAERVAQVTAKPFSGRGGLSSLIGPFLIQAATVLDEVDASDSARLAGNVLDLLVTALASRLSTRPTDVDSARRVLLMHAMAFVEQNLGDAYLTPAEIAAAQHISTRYLHKIFHAEGTTVSAWIRQRRLANCSRDLRDPRLSSRSVSAIAARWGLPDAAHFSRLFRATFGTSPRDYRVMHGLSDSQA
jgi:AraC-like DNA-binding protein